MGNLTGNVFDKDVIKQIEARQIFLGSRYKSDSNLIYSNNTSRVFIKAPMNYRSVINMPVTFFR